MARRKSPELKDLVKRVAEWRAREGGRGSRIPDQLWQGAVQASRTVGVWATAKALHFNYEALKRRFNQAGGREEATPSKRGKVGIASGAGPMATWAKPADLGPMTGNAEASFVAFPIGELGAGGRAVIDLVGRHGDRMRVDVAGGVDIVGLVRTFWNGQS